MTMKVLKRALSLFIVGLFVFTAFAVIQSGGSQAQASPSASSSFTFPYQYGTPTIPSDVGAQGIQGLTVPLSDIGAQVPMPHLTAGKGSPLMVSRNVNVSILVYNGTKNSKSISVDSSVQLLNSSFDKIYATNTSTHGYANMTVTAGWYVIHITQKTDNYINFTQLIDIKNSESLTYFLIPSSYSVDNVNNGNPTSYVTVWDSSQVAWPNSYANKLSCSGQITVDLLNVSNSNKVVGSAVTLINGTVEFKNVSSAYSYDVEAIGYNQSLTGIYYNGGNQSGGVSTTSSVNYAHTTTLTLNNIVYKSPDITGTPLANSVWSISSNTTVENGAFLLGAALSFSANYKYSLVFRNDTVWIAGPAYVSPGSGGFNISIINSTIIYLRAGNLLCYSEHSYISNSIIYTGATGSGNPYTSPAGSTFAGKPDVVDSVIIGPVIHPNLYPTDDYFGFALASNISYSTIFGVAGTYGLAGGNISHSMIINSTYTVRPYSIENSILNNTILCKTGIIPVHTVYVNDTVLYESSLDFHKMYMTNSTWDILCHSTDNSIPELSSSGSTANTTGDGVTLIYDTIKSVPTPGQNISQQGKPGVYAYNISVKYSLFNLSTPTYQLTLLANYNLTADNNYFAMPDEATMCSYFNRVSFLSDWNILSITSNRNTVFLHNYVNNTGLDQINGFNLTAENNLMVNYFTGDAFYNFGSPGEYDINYPEHYLVTNNTWTGMTFNYKLQNLIASKIYGAYGTKVVFNGNSGPQHFFPYDLYENITYNTFNIMPLGSDYGINPSSVVWLTDTGAYNIVAHNLFTNSPQSVIGNISYSASDNGIYSSSPFAADIIPSAGLSYIEDNVFEHLNNMTVPIVQSASNDVDGWNPALHLSGNDFYYMPMALESKIPVNGMFKASQLIGTNSTMAYEIPIDLNGTITGQSNQYVFNTSFIQTNFEPNGYASNSGVTPTVWSWAIAPDVNTLSGTPTISYSNGFVGGPQPDFIWKGYNYSESVEPTYIQVGVNSSKAPSVDLQFTGVPGIKYLVQAFSQGSEFESFVENASSSGILNATYNPASMPLDPTFEVSPYVAPPPPYNPVQPNPPMNFFPAYVFYILLATSAAGVAAGIYIMIRRR